MIHLDTHAVIWLAGGQAERVPAALRRRFESTPPSVSPMVALELDLLHEIGRIREPGLRILDHLEATIGLTLSPVPFASAVAPMLPLGEDRERHVPIARVQAGRFEGADKTHPFKGHAVSEIVVASC